MRGCVQTFDWYCTCYLTVYVCVCVFRSQACTWCWAVRMAALSTSTGEVEGVMRHLPMRLCRRPAPSRGVVVSRSNRRTGTWRPFRRAPCTCPSQRIQSGSGTVVYCTVCPNDLCAMIWDLCAMMVSPFWLILKKYINSSLYYKTDTWPGKLLLWVCRFRCFKKNPCVMNIEHFLLIILSLLLG